MSSLPNDATPDTSPSISLDTLPSTDSELEGIGMSNPQLSEGRRRMLDLINRLHSTGVQKDMDLPQIAVIGSQSAGKSSLIESISGITLPRAAGTCTRCPTECRLAYSPNAWKCIVSLRFITDSRGQALAQVRDVKFGDDIDDKSLVEERLRRAQRAILNPSTPPTVFLTGEDKDPDVREMTFSTNLVSLQISGKDVADLSFCDLPGLIASVGKEGNENDIKMVQNLVTSYISKPSCVILSTVACETDFENQGAHHLARKHDPEGKRTIGVLTKPDRIPPGEEERWFRFIRNEKEPLLHGWFCVKQPDSRALSQGISWKEARAEEQLYFSLGSTWSSLDSTCQKALGTINLMERLSTVLSELISKRLPEIQEELQNLIRKTEEDIRKLPKAPSSDPFGEVVHLIWNFTSELSRHLEGTPDPEGLLQSFQPAQSKFRRAIRNTMPKFLPYEKKSHKGSLCAPGFLATEEDDSEDSFAIRNSVDVIYVDEVFQRAQTARTRELPDNYPFVVQAAYISDITAQWLEPALNLFDETEQILAKYVQNIVTKSFGHFGRGGLERMVQLIVTQHLKQCADMSRDKIQWLVDVEKRAFTLNTHYFSDYKSKFLTYYRGRRADEQKPPTSLIKQSKVSANQTNTYVSEALSTLSLLGYHGVQAEDLPRLLPADPMDPALQIMASVRGYFQVAYKRFTDIIPMAIDYEFVFGIEREMRQALLDGLKISGPDGHKICQELGQEPPNVASRRERLRNQLERLGRAREELMLVRI